VDFLTERWLAALPTGTDPGTADRTGADLLRRWDQRHRHYHTRRHLAAMLSIVDANAGLAHDPDAVRLATWFHDAVYDPTAGDNEEASARLAGSALTALGVPAPRVAEVVRLVRLTAGHDPEPGDRNGCLLADADLAILASEPEDYDAYAAAVRREYAHVPDPLYRLGRRAVLERLLALPHLFRIVPARTEWTLAARDNLTRELMALRG
jgi:predicted metal-dependent HD superfamily phosphohydrolase